MFYVFENILDENKYSHTILHMEKMMRMLMREKYLLKNWKRKNSHLHDFLAEEDVPDMIVLFPLFRSMECKNNIYTYRK